jgi:hypothetical protein
MLLQGDETADFSTLIAVKHKQARGSGKPRTVKLHTLAGRL